MNRGDRVGYEKFTYLSHLATPSLIFLIERE